MGVSMSNLINVNPKKSGKDCIDWEPVSDGTITGDPKYCALSLLCKQIGMRSDWVNFKDPNTGEFIFDYFCTGMYVKEIDKGKDEEIS